MPWSQAAPKMRCLQGVSSGVGVVWVSLLAGEAALPGPAQLPEPQGKASPFPVHCSDHPCPAQSSRTSWKFAFNVGMAHVPLVRKDPAQELAQLPLSHSILGAQCHRFPSINPQRLCFCSLPSAGFCTGSEIWLKYGKVLKTQRI